MSLNCMNAIILHNARIVILINAYHFFVQLRTFRAGFHWILPRGPNSR